MLVNFNISIEKYDNSGDILIHKNAKIDDKIINKFIKSEEDIEKEVIKIIEKMSGNKFCTSNAEANKYISSSLVYHLPKKNEHLMYFIRVEHKGKKIEFKDYYFDEAV